MFWHLRVKFHGMIAKGYMLMLTDEYKRKYPDRYNFANKRWRYHVNKIYTITTNHINEMLERL